MSVASDESIHKAADTMVAVRKAFRFLQRCRKNLQALVRYGIRKLRQFNLFIEDNLEALSSTKIGSVAPYCYITFSEMIVNFIIILVILFIIKTVLLILRIITNIFASP